MKLQTCTVACNGDTGLRTEQRAPRRAGRRVIELAIVVALALGIVYAESWAIQQSPTLPGADNYAVSTDKNISTDGAAKTFLCSLPIAVLH
jgi:hypothetical protein